MSLCASCQKPLILELDASSDEEDMPMSSSGKAAAAPPTTVPDDVHLRCGCHFHWDCLLSSYSIDSCPACTSPLISPSPSGTAGQAILCTLSNEGGVQTDLDILPLLTEEAYLKAYPEERKARAFLEFCRAGDLGAVVEMIQGGEEEDDEEDEEDEDEDEDEDMGGNDGDADGEKKAVDFLRYQDPIGDMQSGLHAAVQAGSREVAWLLLLMASRLDLQEFPAQVFQEAEAIGIMRMEGEMEGKADIRSLRDAQGKTAEDVAREMGVVWGDWVGTGRLAV